ncbi:MAG: diaminopimelate epimerase [Gammaproteobacteria bacterium]|nr:diaminopimelate epimerase [Gammaproteobacteria bacterium]MCP4090252.1 diaminopimelate epimerase [Gammaproteobacteria bacterium]MCP4276331.1 diaminopimelate epimerase [Gammaproteobacteria bacterium]MCP4831196.1 diaminopimelate epimerase [Gammaproteobacteria bacterium]MCP4930124.1 diaminopimelate epimerase [Gammaproteobacteria bacterium]
MHGLGNDFIVIRGVTAPAPEVITRLAARHTGIGFDQLLWLEEPRTADTDIFYRIFNADGGEVEQCGNGARCIARYIAGNSQDLDRVWKLAFQGGVINALLQPDGDVAVSMGEPDFSPDSLPFIANAEAGIYTVNAGDDMVELAVVSMGNPHAVITVVNIDVTPVEQLGALLEQHKRFPNRANIGFMQVISPERIRLRVFERGVGETSACGTGACAAVVTGQRAGKLAEEVTVELPGGELRVRWAGSGAPVWLTGEAVTVFEGIVDL